jgi:hypothetical protein
MSAQTEEAAPGPDTIATAGTNDTGAQKDETALSTATELEHGNGTAEGNASNGAKKAESSQDKSESALNVQKEEATKYRGDSKRNFSNRGDRSGNQYPKRENKSKYDPNAEPVPDDAAARAQKIRNLVCHSEGVINL